jgi:hypothetical protein
MSEGGSKGVRHAPRAVPEGVGFGSLQNGRVRTAATVTSGESPPAPLAVPGDGSTPGAVWMRTRRERARIDEISTNNRRMTRFLNGFFTIHARFVHGFFTNQAG